MNTLIFRTMAPAIVVVMMMFAVFVLLRGHNEPGGGFIGGLIAAAAIAVYGIASGPAVVRRAIRMPPMSFAALGVILAAGSGLLSLAVGAPFLTGLWTTLLLGETEIALSTPLLFDIGVFLIVFGTVSAVALALEDSEGAP
jgi:multicomponent Na+:H+ antiporter subunit B